jgi:hypothetical protein
MEKWFAAAQPVKIGGAAPVSNPCNVPAILKDALGLPIQLVSGYKGTSRIPLAGDSGEVDGGCWSWESIKVTWKKESNPEPSTCSSRSHPSRTRAAERAARHFVLQKPEARD